MQQPGQDGSIANKHYIQFVILIQACSFDCGEDRGHEGSRDPHVSLSNYAHGLGKKCAGHGSTEVPARPKGESSDQPSATGTFAQEDYLRPGALVMDQRKDRHTIRRRDVPIQ